MIFVLLAALAFAQTPPAKVPKKPVSISYEAVLRCFPELEDDSQAFKVDLGRLRERIDLHFPTLRTYMQSRTVKFTDGAGVTRRVKVEESRLGKGLTATWETVSADGLLTPWTDSGVKAQNPSLSEINSVLAKGSILSDERIDVDTKIKDVTLILRRSVVKVVEMRLEQGAAQRLLTCEDKGEFGSICLCQKKATPPVGK